MKENKRQSEGQPNSLQEDSTVWIDHFDDELFGKSKERTKKPKVKREQKDVNKNNYRWMKRIKQSNEKNHDINKHELDISSEELKILQATDTTIRVARESAKTGDTERGKILLSREYCTENGFLEVEVKTWQWIN